MSRSRLVRAALLIGAALALGAAPPPAEEARPSAWNRFVNGAKHALFDRENPRTAGKQSPEREKSAKADKPMRSQAPPRAGSVSGQAKFQRTLPGESQIRPPASMVSDREGFDEAAEPSAEEVANEPAEALPPVARSTRQSRGSVKPASANSPVAKTTASKAAPDKKAKRGTQKPRTVSEYMAQERP